MSRRMQSGTHRTMRLVNLNSWLVFTPRGFPGESFALLLHTLHSTSPVVEPDGRSDIAYFGLSSLSLTGLQSIDF